MTLSWALTQRCALYQDPYLSGRSVALSTRALRCKGTGTRRATQREREERESVKEREGVCVCVCVRVCVRLPPSVLPRPATPRRAPPHTASHTAAQPPAASVQFVHLGLGRRDEAPPPGWCDTSVGARESECCTVFAGYVCMCVCVCVCVCVSVHAHPRVLLQICEEHIQRAPFASFLRGCRPSNSSEESAIFLGLDPKLSHAATAL